MFASKEDARAVFDAIERHLPHIAAQVKAPWTVESLMYIVDAAEKRRNEERTQAFVDALNGRKL